MLDNLDQALRLLEMLEESLPLSAAATPRLADYLREQLPGRELPRHVSIVSVDYAGEEGGILCELDVGEAGNGHAFYVSLTHLAFDRRLPHARAIAAYQKHRIKRLRLCDPHAILFGSPALADVTVA